MNEAGVPRVAAVVLNYRRADETVECVRSLERCGYPGLKLVIVDNGSADGSDALIRAACDGQDVIQTGANLGFAAGNNFGIRHALHSHPDYVLVINNDTLVPLDFSSRW